MERRFRGFRHYVYSCHLRCSSGQKMQLYVKILWNLAKDCVFVLFCSACNLQEKIMRVPYGLNKEFFKYSLFLVFCNRLTTSAVSAGALLVKPTKPKLVFVFIF